MLRAAAFSLLIVSLLAAPLAAQRGAFHPAFTGLPAHAGSDARLSGTSPHGALHRRALRRDRSGALFAPYWYPYDDGGGYEEPVAESAPVESRPVILQSPAPERPPTEPKIIEVPGASNAAALKPQPPAVFVFRNGERLEAQRFLLRTSNLLVNVNRQQRSIPFDQLDLDATLAANRERGIDLRIPADPNEISLSF